MAWLDVEEADEAITRHRQAWACQVGARFSASSAVERVVQLSVGATSDAERDRDGVD